MKQKSAQRRGATSRLRLVATLVAAVAAVTATAGAACPTPGAPPKACPAIPFWVNDGIAPFELNRYSASGTLLNSVNVALPFFDIATNANGSLIYGLEAGIPDNRLHTIDPATGASINIVTITGVLPTELPNGLSLRPNGMLIAGSGQTNRLYEINPTTGVATLLPVSLPPGNAMPGDIITLADGDLLAIVYTLPPTFPLTNQRLIRIHPNGTHTVLGTLPDGIGFFGLTISAGLPYLAADNGAIYRLPNVPTGASDQPLPLQQIVAPSAGLSWFGAASVQDDGRTCRKPYN